MKSRRCEKSRWQSLLFSLFINFVLEMFI